MFDLSSNFCFHLRITGDLSACILAVTEFCQKWSPVSAITGFERSEKGVEHSHTHIEFTKELYEYHDSDKGKTARATFFRKLNLAKLYNFQKLDKDPIFNLKYCIKDDDIIFKKSVDIKQLEEIKKLVLEVKESQKTESRHKLLTAFIKHIKQIINKFPYLLVDTDENELSNDKQAIEYIDKVQRLSYIAQFIHKLYINEWDKEPPVGNRMKGYVYYIAEKITTMNIEISYHHALEIAYNNI